LSFYRVLYQSVYLHQVQIVCLAGLADPIYTNSAHHCLVEPYKITKAILLITGLAAQQEKPGTHRADVKSPIYTWN